MITYKFDCTKQFKPLHYVQYIEIPLTSCGHTRDENRPFLPGHLICLIGSRLRELWLSPGWVGILDLKYLMLSTSPQGQNIDKCVVNMMIIDFKQIFNASLSVHCRISFVFRKIQD